MNLMKPMNPMRLRVAAIALAALLGAAGMLAAAAPAPNAARAEAGWTRPTVAGQQVGGAYLTLRGGAVADRLLSVRSPAAARAEIHRMEMQGDVMRMREVAAIDLPAGATLELQPGGLHLMLMDLKQPLKAGTRVPLTLQFQQAGAVSIELQVRPAAPAATREPAPAADKAHQH